MCGIVGYVGKSSAAPKLLDGLARLEYRGYDSAGLAVYNGEKILVKKSRGKLVAAVVTQQELYDKTRSNIVELKSRGAFVMAVTNEDNTDIEEVADYVIYIPVTNRYFTDSLAIIPLQLFAYFIAVGKGCDVDKPRNLAKSVTVE